MRNQASLAVFLFSSLSFLLPAHSQQTQLAPVPPAAASQAGQMNLDVVVTGRSGPPVAGLPQQDFSLFDNKTQEPITSFREVQGSQAPIQVVIVVDAVNTAYTDVANERQEIERFLHQNGGHLQFPTSIAVFTDQGIALQKAATTDGTALSSYFDSYVVGLREIRRDDGFVGDAERYQLSTQAVHSLIVREASTPGRKIVLWVSPGWPLLTGPDIGLTSKQEQGLFADIVTMSTAMRQSQITLYSIDPLGPSGPLRFFYQEFLKGVTKPIQASPGSLALQVLALQSGGLALSASNDVVALLNQCMADTSTYYEISFHPPHGERSGEYHEIQVRLSTPGLTARTRTGYYSQP
jgi:VWFA-related protein